MTKRNLIIALAISIITATISIPASAQCDPYYNYNCHVSNGQIALGALAQLGNVLSVRSITASNERMQKEADDTLTKLNDQNNATARYYYDRQLDAIKVVTNAHVTETFDNNRKEVKVEELRQVVNICNQQYSNDAARLACMRLMLSAENPGGTSGNASSQNTASAEPNFPGQPHDVLIRNVSRSRACMDIPGVAPARAQMSTITGLNKTICVNPGEDYTVGNAKSLNIVLKGTDNGLCANEREPNSEITSLGNKEVKLFTVDDDSVHTCDPRNMTANAATSTAAQTGRHKDNRQPIRD